MSEEKHYLRLPVTLFPSIPHEFCVETRTQARDLWGIFLMLAMQGADLDGAYAYFEAVLGEEDFSQHGYDDVAVMTLVERVDQLVVAFADFYQNWYRLMQGHLLFQPSRLEDVYITTRVGDTFIALVTLRQDTPHATFHF